MLASKLDESPPRLPKMPKANWPRSTAVANIALRYGIQNGDHEIAESHAMIAATMSEDQSRPTCPEWKVCSNGLITRPSRHAPKHRQDHDAN